MNEQKWNKIQQQQLRRDEGNEWKTLAIIEYVRARALVKRHSTRTLYIHIVLQMRIRMMVMMGKDDVSVCVCDCVVCVRIILICNTVRTMFACVRIWQLLLYIIAATAAAGTDGSKYAWNALSSKWNIWMNRFILLYYLF